MKLNIKVFNHYKKLIYLSILCVFIGVSSCTSQTPNSELLKVVATTTIIGDVVRIVGGEYIQLTVLLPVDTDPHSFSPAPKAIADIENADVVFINGFGLEESLEDLIASTAEEKMISISEGIETIEFDAHSREENEHNHEGVDPHVWMSPINVRIWVNNTVETLTKLDPIHSEVYQSNAEAYLSELTDLHNWILEQIAQIPQENRLLITDHDTFSYFADLYSFKVIGVLLPGGSTLAEPSAQDIARLENDIEAFQVPAIFVSITGNQILAERVSMDTGVKIIPLYTGSLSSSDGPVPTYIRMMRYNVTEIVNALKP